MKRATLLLVVLAIPAVASAQYPGPSWTCSLDNIGATLTRCIVAPEPGLRRYITDIIAQSTTATGGQFVLRYGTGTNCGTGPTDLFPSNVAGVATFAAPGNASAPTVVSLMTPLIVPNGKDLCLLGVATNTTTIQIIGYVAP